MNKSVIREIVSIIIIIFLLILTVKFIIWLFPILLILLIGLIIYFKLKKNIKGNEIKRETTKKKKKEMKVIHEFDDKD